jgi:threonine dehydratase
VAQGGVLQRAGSFKIRGALNVISASDGEPVVAASAGNHAQGVALAAAFCRVGGTVFMPETAPIPKVNATREYGAEVRLTGTSLAEAVSAALEYSRHHRRSVRPSLRRPAIVAGQGTLGLEIVEQLPEVGTVIVPTGGGGLLAGTALAVKSLPGPTAHVIGVEIDVAPTYLESRRAGRPVRWPVRPTIADGINVTVASDFMFEMIEEHVDDLVTVTTPRPPRR